jgi:NSS family neurotransmitter:Na+ symporter
MNPKAGRETWTTRLGAILAVTGSAVGLGNFLRFPGLAAQYGGGAFMIPYVVAFLLLGLPIAWVEWSMGRFGGAHGYNSAPGVFRAVCGKSWASYLALLGPLIPVVIYMYYVFVEAWCLGYAWNYLTGALRLGNDAAKYQAFFSAFVGDRADGAVFTAAGSQVLVFLAICFVLNFLLIYRGLQKGIEWFCQFAMPALVVCALIVLVRVLTLGTPDPALPEQSLVNGLGAMWNPTKSGQTLGHALANPEIWLAAAGQIFFSLSVGFGIIITYSSYVRKDDDVALSALTAASGNGFCEVVLGGLITIPAAFVFLGQPFVDNPPGTFSMGFVSLPNVFNLMPAGAFFGFVFFFLLFLAAVTSSLSMLQPAIALFEEGLGVGRKASVAMLGIITLMGALFIVTLSRNLTALDTVDFWVGNVCIYIMATVQVILFGWVLGLERGMAELDRGAEIRLPRLLGFVIKYVSPLYLLIIFGLWLWQKLPERIMAVAKVEEGQPPVVAMSLGLIFVVLIFFALIISRSVRRWDKLDASQTEVSP